MNPVGYGTVAVDSQVEFAFTVRTNLDCYVKLELFDKNECFKVIKSQNFNCSTKFYVTIPSQTTSIDVSIGAIRAATWQAPFDQKEKGLEVKNHSLVYSHDFELHTWEREFLK